MGSAALEDFSRSINIVEINLINSEDYEYPVEQTPARLNDFSHSSGESVFEERIEEREVDSPTESKINLKPLIRWLVYGLAFLTPLFFLPWSSEFLEFNKQTLLAVGAGVGLILFLVDVIQNGVLNYKPSRLYLPVAVLMGASILTAAFSKNLYQSFLGNAGGSLGQTVLSIVALAIFFFLALNTITDKGRKLAKVLTGSFGLVFLFSVLQVFGVRLFSGASFTGASFNTIGSMNTLAIVGALLIPLFLESKFRFFKYFDISKLAVALVLFMIVLINWWLVWLAAFVSLAGWMGYRTFESKKPSLRIFIMPMSVVAIGVLLVLIKFNMPILKARLPVEVAPSYSTSISIAREVLKEKLVFGYGQGSFNLAYDKFKPTSIANTIFATTRFTQSSSAFFTAAVEGGIIMLLAWLFLIVWSGWELYRSRSRSGFATLGFLIFFFLFPFNVVLMFLLFAALSLLELENVRSAKKSFDFEHSPVFSLVGSLVFIVGLVAVLAGGYFITTRYIGETYYVKALTAKSSDDSISNFTKATNINSTNADYYRLLSQAALNRLATELNNKDTKPEEKNQKVTNLAASAVDIAKRATDASPDDSQNWVNRGIIYQNLISLVNGADTAAISMYQEALKRNPADPVTYSRIGAIYLTVAETARSLAARPAQGQNPDELRKVAADNFTKAEENYRKAVELNNNFGQAIYDLGVVYEREGRLADSIRQLEKIRTSNPNDPSIAFELGLLYYRNNQKDAAFKQLQQATALFPNYSNARWYLSLLYEELGDLDNALIQVEEIQKTNPDNELVKQRITQLTAGKRLIPPGKVLDQKPL